MRFDWRKFCRGHGVEYVTEGKSTTKGNINIRCPFCGEADHGHHLGLSLDPQRPFWHCWRNRDHRGRDPVRLIVQLLNCSVGEARELVAADDRVPLDDYDALVERLRRSPTPQDTPRSRRLQMPDEFHALDEGRHAAKYRQYLETRGFDQVERKQWYYGLRYCLTGHFARRIVLPVFDHGKLVSWTARDITGKSELRYRTLSDNPETARSQGYDAALMNVKDTLYNIDEARFGGRLLLLCEGPLDALKVDWYAPPEVTAVAFFGMPTARQIALAVRLSRNFEQVGVLLDTDATVQAMQVRDQLQGLIPSRLRLFQPLGGDDPGAMSPQEVRGFCTEALRS